MYFVDVDSPDLAAIVRALREEGSDTTSIEVKLATGGFPSDLARTLSAFANTPGGGIVILGLDEHDGFAARGVYDEAQAQSTMASVARQALDPPVTLTTSVYDFENARVVVAEIDEAPASHKPCRLKASGKAYLRAYDGDYQMSELEMQAFVANRDQPRFDRQIVADATIDDLDGDLLTIYRETCRASSTSLSRFDDHEILLRTGVVAGDDARPTLAGLLALGKYPQQYAPNLVIQASVAPGPGDPPGTRAADARKFDGPLPVMLDEATRWVQRNTRTRVRFGEDGHGRDEPEYPVEAVRELIANALVHRDLGPHAMAYPVSLRLEHNQLVISNPGGLWGITLDRLGREHVSSARNDILLRIAQNVRSAGGRRVVEAIASGIPTVLSSLANAGMVPPTFHDQGIRFTVRVPNHALLAAEDLNWLAQFTPGHTLSDTQRHALVAMRHGRRWTNRTFREVFPKDSTAARADLQGLVDAGLAIAEGENRGREYMLAPGIAGASETASRSDGQREHHGGMADSGPVEERRTRLPRTQTEETVRAALRDGPLPVTELASVTGLTRRQVEYALKSLRERGTVSLDGAQGVRDSRYRLSETAPSTAAQEEPRQ